MNHLVIVRQHVFDITMINWLTLNVSQQGVGWIAEIDTWERRMVYFKHQGDADRFKARFGL